MLLRLVLALGDTQLQRQLARRCRRPHVLVETLRGRGLRLDQVARRDGDVVVISRTVLEDSVPDGLALLREVPDPPAIIMLSDRESPEERAELLTWGCEAVLSRSLPVEKISEALLAIMTRRRQLAEKPSPGQVARPAPRLADFVSTSPAMRRFLELVRRVVMSNTSLLVLGETGVGKEHLARAIHSDGPRSQAPFIAVNCAALPETLLESELFGHDEGAFTGATHARRGCFEMAHRGTIFLDEIGEMPAHLQVRLLRVLQERNIQRLGGEKLIPVDVRVMAATNRDLQADVEARRFRKDLFFRLSVVNLTIPPLRERREDIPHLVEDYLAFLRPQVGREVRDIAPEALAALVRYSWPGNVRELFNVLERAMLLCNGTRVTLTDLPVGVNPVASSPAVLDGGSGSKLGAVLPEELLNQPLEQFRLTILSRYEREYLCALLRSTGGRIGETARRAGIRPRSLYDRMKLYGLRKEEFRSLLDGKPPAKPVG